MSHHTGGLWKTVGGKSPVRLLFLIPGKGGRPIVPGFPDSAIKLAAGNNPNITSSIFAMPNVSAFGRRLAANRVRGIRFLIASCANWLISFPGNELLWTYSTSTWR